jgi:hypothetical protein
VRKDVLGPLLATPAVLPRNIPERYRAALRRCNKLAPAPAAVGDASLLVRNLCYSQSRASAAETTLADGVYLCTLEGQLIVLYALCALLQDITRCCKTQLLFSDFSSSSMC